MGHICYMLLKTQHETAWGLDVIALLMLCRR